MWPVLDKLSKIKREKCCIPGFKNRRKKTTKTTTKNWKFGKLDINKDSSYQYVTGITAYKYYIYNSHVKEIKL